MLRVDKTKRTLQPLELRSLPDAGWKERQDLQQMIRNSPEAFFGEMGESLLLLGEEIRPAELVEDRIDLLAIDPRGIPVVIELKRGSNKLQLLQAVSYAAMVSKWEGSRLVELRQALTGRSQQETEAEIEEFTIDYWEKLNESQRIVLIAEDFEYEVLIAAEWLNENYGVDIRCYRLTISADGQTEYLNCTCIFPPPELSKHAVRRSRGTPQPLKWNDWDAALSGINNSSVVGFFKKELAANQESYLGKRVLYYRLHEVRRLFAAARTNSVYVWQYCRFENDIQFWLNAIGQHIEVKAVKGGQCLRFVLSQPPDFEKFTSAIHGPLTSVTWSGKDGSLEGQFEEGGESD